ncbi:MULTISPECIES: TetR/AcrR family transcriptional regulator [Microbacterium]|uniref:TetR/AcrR family transcriptional regulator n=1 Tax=Microbacterium TaxID=33882 RepID=UPI000D657F17|nr:MULTISPECIES: TetR/AcrR family transcriptional regulator [Microbacterium]
MADGVPDTETAILDAALAEVLAHGIRRTTASDIARRCGIARQTLYRYWPDAQAVFAALVTRELLAALPAGQKGCDDLDQLVTLLVETADRVRRLPLVDRLRDTDPELFARYILDRLGTSQRAIHAETAARLAEGQRAGYVRPGDPVQLAAMVLLIAQSAVQSAPLVAEWLPDDAWRVELSQALRGYLMPIGDLARRAKEGR